MRSCFDCFLNKKPGSKVSHLCHAVRVGDVDMVRISLDEASANVNDQNRFGRTALHYACRFGRLEIAHVLIREYGARVDLTTNTMATAAHECCRFGQAHVLRVILESNPELAHSINTFGSLPIHVACNAVSAECVQVLLEHGSSTTARNKKGMTPLHIACENADSRTSLLLLNSGPSTQLLIRDVYDCLPIHYACQNDMSAVLARMLPQLALNGHLERVLTVPDCTGTTALQYAAQCLGTDPLTIGQLQAHVAQHARATVTSETGLAHKEVSDVETFTPLSSTTVIAFSGNPATREHHSPPEDGAQCSSSPPTGPAGLADRYRALPPSAKPPLPRSDTCAIM